VKPAIRRASPALSIASLALAVLALAASAALGAVGYQHESLQEFEAQLKGRQIHEATINKRLRTVRLSLTDGRHMLAEYAPHEEPKVLAELTARHVPVTVLGKAQAKKTTKKPAHKLRYIAGGIVIAVVVIVGGVMLYNRRRRAMEGLS
jgi:ATP-dependent Zn protease